MRGFASEAACIPVDWGVAWVGRERLRSVDDRLGRLGRLACMLAGKPAMIAPNLTFFVSFCSLQSCITFIDRLLSSNPGCPHRVWICSANFFSGTIVRWVGLCIQAKEQKLTELFSASGKGVSDLSELTAFSEQWISTHPRPDQAPNR